MYMSKFNFWFFWHMLVWYNTIKLFLDSTYYG